jgi:hypothetical protein
MTDYCRLKSSLRTKPHDAISYQFGSRNYRRMQPHFSPLNDETRRVESVASENELTELRAV